MMKTQGKILHHARSTDPLPNAAIAIAKDIQAEALIQYNELYDILLLDRSHHPDVQVNTEALTQTEAVSLVTPCEEDSSCPITTSTEVITKANATSLLLPTESITYESPMHGRIIDVQKLCGFLVDCINREKLVEFKKSYLFASCRHHFETVAAAASNIWDRTKPAMQAPCRSILVQYGGLPSNTQMVES
jgi:hypothetical protein